MPQMKIRRMRVACWIPKVKNTLRMCKTYCSSTATMVARTPLNATFYVYCLFCSYLRVAYSPLMFEYMNKEDSPILGSVEHVLKQWWLWQICDYIMGLTAEKLDFNGWFSSYIFTFPGAQNSPVAHQILQSDASWSWVALAFFWCRG